MRAPATAYRERRVLMYALAFALAQATIALTGLADGPLLSDDAFYYFQVARNAALGHSYSFDGVHPTNGFHPLFAWVCTPLYWIAPESKWGPIHAALVLMGVCAAATGYVLDRLGRTAVSERAGELMAVCFFLSPFAWLLPQRGCGDALSVLCLALSAWQVAHLTCARAPTTRDAALAGVLVGLAMLARTENLLWAAPVGVWLLWRSRRLAPALAYGTVASLVLAPWLIWNLLRFGTIVQVSGAAKQAIDIYGRLPPLSDPRNLVLNVYHVFEHSVRWVLGEEFAEPNQTTVYLIVLAALVVIAAIASRRIASPAALVPLYVFLALHLAFYAYQLRHYFSWYFLPVALCIAVFLGERLAQARRSIVIAMTCAQITLLVWAQVAFFKRHGWHPRGAEAGVAARTAAFNGLPRGAQVGVWNAGAMGYFTTFLHPHVRVVNLDCLVNNELFAAFKRGAYASWILSEVNFVAEEPANLILFMGEQPALDFYQRHLQRMSENPPLYRVVATAAWPPK
jgi:hypothetical protein